MRIGIISDLHLGHRQYGSLEREEDFYNQFLYCMTHMMSEKPDVVVIAGDIFDKPNPSPKAMDIYRKGIAILNGIPVIAITGNHTMLMRDDHYTVDNYFAESGIENYHLIDDDNIIIDGIDFHGLIYRSDSDLDSLFDARESLFDQIPTDIDAPDYDFIHSRILIIHQAVKEFCGFTGAELSIEDLDPSKYDAIICGHIHSPLFKIFSEAVTFIQPGSIERLNTTEARDEIEKGKGFWIFDTEDPENPEFCKVPALRKFLLGDIEFKTLEDIENHFDKLKKDLSKMDKPPIISYNYYDYSGNSVHIRELMKSHTKGALINNSNVYDMTEEEISLEITDNEIPTIAEALKMTGTLDDDELKLAKDIHESFSKGLEESTEGILDKFFETHKKTDTSDIEKEYQERIKEIKEYEEFFDNLGGE